MEPTDEIKKAKGKTQNKSRCQMMISLGPELCVAGEPFSLRYIRTWSFSQTKQVDLRDTSAQQSPRTSEKGQNIESNPTTHLPFFSLSLFFVYFSSRQESVSDGTKMSPSFFSPLRLQKVNIKLFLLLLLPAYRSALLLYIPCLLLRYIYRFIFFYFESQGGVVLLPRLRSTLLGLYGP